ncbi:unnamed protein product [Allacma fusca]|uniref:O-acyltransferase n=1 Tax=Allacma fusca TaxID=39272 RepID=A0A8J2KYS4_9HEXA|nr:unnamed protein product [Allacma fusca]
MGGSSEGDSIMGDVRDNSEPLESKSGGNHIKSYKKRSKTLPEKEFRLRQSILTELMEQKHFQACHNFIIALMVHYALGGIVTDFVESGSLDLGLTNAKNLFGKPILWLKLVVLLHLTPMLVLYPGFYLWANYRSQKYFNSTRHLLDKCFYLFLTGIFLMVFYIPIRVHFQDERIPYGACAVVVIEQLRISMKMYAFARTNIKRILNPSVSPALKSKLEEHVSSNKHRGSDLTGPQSNENLRNRKNKEIIKGEETETDFSTHRSAHPASEFKSFDEDILCPDFSKLLYFLYAPTLIYRDHYPRNNIRRWDFIGWHLAHMFGCVMFYSLVQHRFGYVLLQNFGPHNPMTFKELVSIGFCQIIVGISAMYLGWVTMLHSMQNVFAELLRFGDRGFYKAWWCCTSMGEYHRTWNTPVQDFLYNYVYKEAWEKGLGQKAKWLPTLLVFVLSNIFHEYAMSFACQFFCPVMGLLFMGPGTFLTFLPNKKFPQLGNIFMLYSFSLGYAFFHIFYMVEHFARVNDCPGASTPLLDFFIPRFLTCGAVKWN